MARSTVLFCIHLFVFVTFSVFAAPANEKVEEKDTIAKIDKSNVTDNPISGNENNQTSKQEGLTPKQESNTVKANSEISKTEVVTVPNFVSTGAPEITSVNNGTIPSNFSKGSSAPPRRLDSKTKIASEDVKSEKPNRPMHVDEDDDFFTNYKGNSETDSVLDKKDFDTEKDKKPKITESEDSSSANQPSYPIARSEIDNDKNSHFFAYFLTLMVATIFLYLLFHNKKRILALLLEGRSEHSRRRSNRARYHKLDNNLEEAMSNTKGSNSSLNQVY